MEKGKNKMKKKCEKMLRKRETGVWSTGNNKFFSFIEIFKGIKLPNNIYIISFPTKISTQKSV